MAIQKKKFLDYDGLKTYHEELVKNLLEQQYDPQYKFDSVADLFTLSNWRILNGAVCIKEGTIVSVGKQIWQLSNKSEFNKWLTMVGVSIEDKAKKSPETIGWQILGSTVDFDVDNHILKLMK